MNLKVNLEHDIAPTKSRCAKYILLMFIVTVLVGLGLASGVGIGSLQFDESWMPFTLGFSLMGLMIYMAAAIVLWVYYI
jgi:hypothetical protein